MQKKYVELKHLNEHLLRQIEEGQQDIDKLNAKKKELEDDLSASPVKQEAGIKSNNH
jgi:predicted  nucleic acid-binding Zn-ribbon protein